MARHYRCATPQDIDFIRRTEQQAFLCSAAEADRFVDRVGLEQFRVLQSDSKPVAALAILPNAQWWLGQKVPMAGIASVSVLPEARRQGNAIALLQGMLSEIYESGTPLSVLYSAADPLYRRMGYGVGGTFCHWQVPVHQIGLTDTPREIQPMPLDVEQMRPTQQQYARHHSGHLDRHRSIWAAIVTPKNDGPEPFAYSVGNSVDEPEGYVVFTLNPGDQSTLTVWDWAMTTPDAGRSLWGFLTRMGSQLDMVHWCGGAIDPMALLLPDSTAGLKALQNWWLRLVNVPQALEARGYAQAIGATLTLNVIDAILPANQGCWTLEVADGCGRVTPGGDAKITLSVSGLASLYAGVLSPYQLRQMGWLEGSQEALAIAAAVFAGPSPWLPNFF
ncbi:MAG: GNAT family N-acetyltransferase [Elainellaceae cyanobacterium]